MKSRHPLKSTATRHNSVVTAARRTTGWPVNKLPKDKRQRPENEHAISNRGVAPTPCACGHPVEMHYEVYDSEGVLRDAYCSAPDCDAACGPALPALDGPR